MPQVGAWVAGALLGTTAAAATATIGGALIAGLVSTVIGVAISLAVAKINTPKGPRPSEITTESRSTSAKRVRHLGRVRASGTIVFYDWTNIVTTRRLFKLLAVADGGMTDVVQWYLNNEPVSVDADGYVTTAPWDKGNVRLRWRKGIEGDGWDGGDWADLRSAFPGYWTADHRLRGIGTILATFDAVDDDEVAEVYGGSEPEVSALIDGAPCYYPVDDTTQHRTNPAIQLADICTNSVYGPLAAADLNLTSFSTAQTRCDSSVPTDGGTRQRYRSGISYLLSDPFKDTAQKLLDAMGGRAWIDNDGKLAVEAGYWTAPTITITEDKIVEMDYGAGTERINRVTALQPSYVAPQIRWQETNADTWYDNDAIALWGEGEPKGVDLLAVQHHGQARHICKQMIARMNPRRRMTLTLRAFGLRLIGERRVAVNIPRLGLSNVPFWIDQLGFDGTNVTVDLIEADPDSFDWTEAEEGEPPAEAEDFDRENPVFSTTIDALNVITGDGPPYIRVSGTWVASPFWVAWAQFRRNGETEWTDMIRESIAGTSTYRFRSNPLADGGTYLVRTYVTSSVQHWKIKSTPVVVTGIDVVENNTPPDAPDIVSESGAAGGTLTVTFVPDLGVNYRRTGLYRAGETEAFADAVFVKWSYDVSSDVTMTSAIPVGGARFWLQSENPSGVKSSAVLVGTYPA